MPRSPREAVHWPGSVVIGATEPSYPMLTTSKLRASWPPNRDSASEAASEPAQARGTSVAISGARCTTASTSSSVTSSTARTFHPAGVNGRPSTVRRLVSAAMSLSGHTSRPSGV